VLVTRQAWPLPQCGEFNFQRLHCISCGWGP